MKHLLACGLALMAYTGAAQTQYKPNHNFEVARNLDIFNALYRELDLNYVDTLEAKKHVEHAIESMLEQIDPYTEYYAEENTDELRQMTTGKYAGIGSVISYRKEADRCVIAEPYEGMPAAQAGLRTGDIILAIDGKDIAPCGKQEPADYSAAVSEKLRGEPGTTFELKVRRPERGRTLTFTLTRRHITRPAVSLAKLVADSVGYIHVAQFTQGAAAEVRRAVLDLKSQGARRLILDLRGNPGGLIEEAVDMVNLFVPRGREVVSTRGKVKEANRTYRTTTDPLDPDMPLAVLTDFTSASSSEITSGALQDYDRAVIIGRRTYGKGLVQQSRELPYKAVLKLTTGKYYIPSGRCVQAYDFKDGEPVHLPDSLAKTFYTAAGRTVRGGGGITPDITVEADSLPRLLTYLAMSDQLFDYCVRYRNTHDSIARPETFSLTAAEYKEFCNYLKQHKFSYDRQSLQLLETLRKVARLEGYDTEARAELDALERKLKHNEDYDFSHWEGEIRKVAESAIVATYYYERGAEAYALRGDKDVERAVSVVCDDKELHRLLSGEPEP